MEISYENKKYTIHMVGKSNYKKYESILGNLLICDKTYIANVLENSIYTLIEDEIGSICFFLTDDKHVLCSIVVDMKCRKLRDFIKEKGYTIRNSIEITLLCANQTVRVAGLTTIFTKYIIQNLPLLKSDIQYVFLYVAKGEKNPKAISFYKKIGFEPDENFSDNYIMILSIPSSDT